MSEDMPWVIGLTDEEVQELRNKKHELTQYGKEKLRQLMEKGNIIKVKVSEEDYQKVVDALDERQELAKKSFEELTTNEKIKLALEELAAIVMGGQDGEEYYNSVKFIKNVLESLKDT